VIWVSRFSLSHQKKWHGQKSFQLVEIVEIIGWIAKNNGIAQRILS